MMMMYCLQVILLCSVFCWQRTPAQDINFPTAREIIWKSINFKTIVEWKGKPTNYTYTVKIRGPGFDWRAKCSYTAATECDVSDLVDQNGIYDVRIFSVIRSEEIIVEEFPHVDGPEFNPFEETIIGKPGIESLEFNEDHTQLKVVVKEPVTPYRLQDKTLRTVRDMFPNNFKYTVFYRKDGSTGRKEVSSTTNEILIETSKGEGYCVFVQASVPSRKTNINSFFSDEKCISSAGNEPDFTILVAVIIAAVLVVVIVILLVIVCVCRQRRRRDEHTAETAKLNNL